MLQAYIASVATHRPVLRSSEQISSCEEIRSRVVGSAPMKTLAFGVAYARIVYRDYEFLEDELRSSYHSQNYFCYSIDRKANKNFHSRIEKLASCLPNVLITADEYDVDGAGHNMNHAHYACMRLLVRKPGWGYVVLLQHEQIDVSESAVSEKQLNASLSFAKGAVQASLSRAAVEWLVLTANLTTLIQQINEMPFGVDEILLESLQISDDIDMPGRFTSKCLAQGQNTDFITRMSHWTYGEKEGCKSRYIRNALCVLGVEDLHSLSQYPNIMANKMLPEFDYAIVECVHEMIFNRTFLGQVDHPLDTEYYSNMVNSYSFGIILEYYMLDRRHGRMSLVLDAKFVERRDEDLEYDQLDPI
ncbi:hypothetical protein ANCCEY_08722 [Ancylostoma ceylanicum]|uniref:Core-2/I-Branching enzyme n=1 Tax=Ancylostoma ceylanicum TaxID=53326 RepID=A0A0D6LLW6_9BILA|nr:hypothetical protein ANCCEY_08722 [Ancylostoma ceylanicum]